MIARYITYYCFVRGFIRAIRGRPVISTHWQMTGKYTIGYRTYTLDVEKLTELMNRYEQMQKDPAPHIFLPEGMEVRLA